MTVNDLTTSGAFSVKAATIVGHNTTSGTTATTGTGSQRWDGDVTFNSIETTNGGNFTVTGIDFD